jgi:transposase
MNSIGEVVAVFIKRREAWRRGLTLGRRELGRLRRARRAARRGGDLALDRRLRAIVLVGHDRLTQESAAQILECTESCITRWVMAYAKGGLVGLVPRKPRGATPRLNEKQLEQLHTVVLHGPEEAGLDTGVWSGPIVQALIAREFGVKLSVSQVRRILHQVGMSVKYPHQQSAAANRKAQAQWMAKTYPEIKKRPAPKVA